MDLSSKEKMYLWFSSHANDLFNPVRSKMRSDAWCADPCGEDKNQFGAVRLFNFYKIIMLLYSGMRRYVNTTVISSFEREEKSARGERANKFESRSWQLDLLQPNLCSTPAEAHLSKWCKTLSEKPFTATKFSPLLSFFVSFECNAVSAGKGHRLAWKTLKRCCGCSSTKTRSLSLSLYLETQCVFVLRRTRSDRWRVTKFIPANVIYYKKKKMHAALNYSVRISLEK